MSRKSQTSTEYMIILAVVLVISLIVVSNLGIIPGIGGNSRSNDAKLRSGTIGITSYSVTDNKTVAIIQNNEPSTLTISSFELLGEDCSGFGQITLAPGSSRTIECDNINSSHGKTLGRDIPVRITYTTTQGATFNQDYGNVGGFSGGGSSPPAGFTQHELDCFWNADKTGCEIYYIVDDPSCGEGTVLDTLTNTCFLRNFSQINGGVGMTWDNAMNECETLDFADRTDWELPTREELLRVVDYGRTSSPAIIGGDNNIFTNVQNQYYWTSSRRLAGSAWLVYLGNGDVGNYGLANARRVVCVSRN